MRHALFVGALAAILGCVPADEETPLVAPGPVTVMTLNIANGAADAFRTAESRVKQGAFVARSAAELVGLQEVDVGADRSGNVDTVASVAAAAAPGFGACTFAVGDPSHMRHDGTRLARCAAGAIVFGTGFRADDPFKPNGDGTPSGIMDSDGSLNPTGVDRGADAFYGNALIVRAPWQVEAAYTVALPVDVSGPNAPPALLDRLAREDPDADAIATLAAHNDGARHQRGLEPRSALVVRVRKSTTTTLSVITTHLEASGTFELKRAQLDTVVAIARAEQQKSNHHVVVMGDFNMVPADAQPSLIAGGFVRATPPEPAAEIDQIWFDPAFSIDAAKRVPTEGVTDHAHAPLATLRPAP
jgi:endonuclease/exonuclease/phosphatase family metal-dependent hydrolase